jgi:hypothetical protein
MNTSKEHKEAENAVENLRNHDTTINSKLNKYIQYLGLNPKNLDLDEIAEDIRKVSGK